MFDGQVVEKGWFCVSSMNKREFQVMLDTQGLSCPLPLLKMKLALNQLQSGEVLYIVTSDPGSLRDFKAWLSQSGHSLLSQSTEENTFHFWIQKA